MTDGSQRVAVFGASGWIGSAISRALRDAGATVTGVFRRAPKRDEGPYLVGDLSDLGPMLSSLAEQDAVVFATSAPAADTNQALRLLADQETVATTAFISGSSVYGDTGTEGPVTESSPLTPPESVSYLPVQEELAMAAAKRSFVFRPAGILYGNRGGATPKFLIEDAVHRGAARYIGSGEQIWSACHVDDLGRLVAMAIRSPSGGGIFNAVTHEYPLKEVASIVARRIGRGCETASISRETATEELGAFWSDLLASSLHVSSEKAHTDFGWKAVRPTFSEDVHQYPLP